MQAIRGTLQRLEPTVRRRNDPRLLGTKSIQICNRRDVTIKSAIGMIRSACWSG